MKKKRRPSAARRTAVSPPTSDERLELVERRGAWLVAVLASVAYLGNLGNGFVYDDRFVVATNAAVQNRDWYALATGGYWGDLVDAGLYRPLTSISFALNHLLTGPDGWGFHLVNDALHVLVSVAVFWLVLRLVRTTSPTSLTPGVALASAALFAVHPAHVEAVTSIVGRADVLACLFVLGGLLVLVAGEESRKSAVLIGGLYFLALASKESAAFALPVFSILDYLCRGRVRRYHQAALALALVSYLAIRIAVFGEIGVSGREIGFIDNPLAHVGLASRLTGGLVVLTEYARLLFWPWPLSADYSFDQLPVLDFGWRNLIGLTLVLVWLVAITGAGIARRRPLVAFALAVAGVPLSGLVHWLFPLGTVVGERLAYLPSVGSCVLMGWAFAWAFRRWSAWGASATLVIVLFSWTGAVHIRNAQWRSNLALFEATAASSPKSARAHFLLGTARMERGEYDLAASAFESGSAIYPEHVPAHFSWAEALMRRQRFAEAAVVYERLLRLEASADALLGLVQSLERDGRVANALEAALDVNRDVSSEELAAELDRLALAVATAEPRRPGLDQLLQSAWQHRPSPAIANALGIRAGMVGDYSSAQAFHQRALELDSRNVVAMNYLGVTAERLGQRELSRSYYEQALREESDFVPSIVNLASWMLADGRLTRAEELYRRASELNPASYEAHNSLGIVLARLGRRAEAAASFRHAIEIDSTLQAAVDNLASLGDLR